MASILVVLRQRLTAAIFAAIQAFGEKVTPALNKRIEPFLEGGETAFDFVLLQHMLGRMISASLKRLVEADKAHLDELTDDIAPRLARDAAVAALRQKLIEIRRIVQGLFGLKRAVEIVAVEGSTAEQPELLWRQGEHTLVRLRDPKLRMPAASTSSVALDPLRLADELEPKVSAVRSAIDAIELEQRQAAASLKLKQEAMAEHDVIVGACARILIGFYQLADRPDLAGRIRLSLPRRGRSGTQVGDATETVAEPAGDAAGETATD